MLFLLFNWVINDFINYPAKLCGIRTIKSDTVPMLFYIENNQLHSKNIKGDVKDYIDHVSFAFPIYMNGDSILDFLAVSQSFDTAFVLVDNEKYIIPSQGVLKSIKLLSGMNQKGFLFATIGDSIIISHFMDNMFDTIQKFSKAQIFTTSDYNGDGNIDIAFVDGNYLKFLFFDKNSNTWIISDSFYTNNIRDIYSNDIDNNGFYDVVFLTSDSTFLIKSFPSGLSKYFLYNTGGDKLAIIDYDNDGFNDICIAAGGEDFRILYIRNGIFSGIDSFPYRANDLLTGDLNNDGKLDLIFSDDSNVYLFLNESDTDNIFISLKGEKNFSNDLLLGMNFSMYLNDSLLEKGVFALGSGQTGFSQLYIQKKLQDLPLMRFSYPSTGVIDTLQMLNRIYYIKEDITNPFSPEEFVSTTHDRGWSYLKDITFRWKSSTDPHGIGISHYLLKEQNKKDTTTKDTILIFHTESQGVINFQLCSVDSSNNVSQYVFHPVKIDNSPPEYPTLISPMDSSIFKDGDITFSWDCEGDSISGILFYIIELSLSEDFSNSFLYDTVFKKQLRLDVNEDGRIYWRVLAIDSAYNTSISEVRRFVIDRRPPFVLSHYPPNESNDIPINTSLWIYFSEVMDTSSFINNISIEGSLSKVHEFTYSFDGYKYTFTPTQEFSPKENVFVLLKEDLKDLAGNSFDGNKDGVGSELPEDRYIFSFTTGDADILPPSIVNVTLNPNPTEGRTNVIIRTFVSDKSAGGSIIKCCNYYIDTDTIHMLPEDGLLNNSEEWFIDTLTIDTLSMPYGSYNIHFFAEDAGGNVSQTIVRELRVTRDTTSPLLYISLSSDTINLGDTLTVNLESNESLKYATYTISKMGTIVKSGLFFSEDSIHFYSLFSTGTFGTGEFNISVEAMDFSGNISTATYIFYVNDITQLLSYDKTFAFPNPAETFVDIYFYVPVPADITLSIYTLSGKRILKKKKHTEGDVNDHIRCFISLNSLTPLANGIYLYVIEAEDKEGRHSKIKKYFSVVR